MNEFKLSIHVCLMRNLIFNARAAFNTMSARVQTQKGCVTELRSSVFAYDHIVDL